MKAGLGLWHADGQSFLLGSCSPFEAGCSQAYPDPGPRLGGNTQQTCSLHGAQWGLGQAPIDGTAPRVSRIVSFRKKSARENLDVRSMVCSRLCPGSSDR